MLCELCREAMIPAALAGLPPERMHELEAHLASCAPCRAAYERTRALSSAIDRGLAAAMTAEPSPQLTARVRTEISRMRAPARWPLALWPVLAGALAALALAALLPRHPAAVKPSARGPEITSTRGRTAEPPSAAPPVVLLRAPAHPTRSPRAGNAARMPEVLVPRGEWSATMRFAAEVERGRVNGIEMLAAVEKLRQPVSVPKVEIPPVVIAPLNDSSTAPPAAGDSNNR